MLITNNDINRKLKCPSKGPFPIVQVYTNDTVRVQNGAVTERIISVVAPLTQTSTSLGGSVAGPVVIPHANKLNSGF